eukprot:scaffold17691_cov64-Cylindrotheca_fusiformis.AAC.1
MEHLDGTMAISVVPALVRILELGSQSKISSSSSIRPNEMSSDCQESETDEALKENHKVPVIVSFSSA